MTGPTPAARKLSSVLPNLKQEGVEYGVFAYKGGVSLQIAEIAQAGASPFAVTFAALGMKDMANASYQVFINGPNGDERADYATRTAVGFSIVGGANTELMGIMVAGRMKGQAT